MTGLTRTRIAALVLIGLAVLGLAYLKLASADAPVSVPKGAIAGDLILDPCAYDTENGSYAADCGTLVVPENRADPQSRQIALPVTRIHARSDHPGEPIFRLEGGPGITNMDFAKASRYADNRDLLVSGLVENGTEIAQHAAVVDVPRDKGHVVLFSNNPIWRGETHGSYFLVFNALLNFDHLDAGRKVDVR